LKWASDSAFTWSCRETKRGGRSIARGRSSACIGRNGGYFLTCLKADADPTIVAVNRAHGGCAISPVGQRLRDVVPHMQWQVLDVEVEVHFPRRSYGGRVHRDPQRLRVVGLLIRETGPTST
jgi:hypothetical protein